MCWWIAKEALETPLFWGSSSWARDRDRKGVSKHQTLPASSTSSLFLWQEKIIPMISSFQQHILMLLVQLWNQEAEVFPSCAEVLGWWWCSGEVGKEDSMWNFPPAEVTHPSKQQSAAHHGHEPSAIQLTPCPHRLYMSGFFIRVESQKTLGPGDGFLTFFVVVNFWKLGCGSSVLTYAHQCLSYSFWIPSAAEEENEAVLVCCLTGLF